VVGHESAVSGLEAARPDAAQEEPPCAAMSKADAPDGPIAGRVWALAQDLVGCRTVQQAFEVARGVGELAALAEELHGHVWEALRSPHANHVLQRCILAVPPELSQFVVDELLQASPVAAAQHKFGCRIVQRLFERCPAAQVQGLVDAILAEALAVAQHPYGNYVLQHLVEWGAPDERRRIFEVLVQDVRGMVSDAHSCAVLCAALACGDEQDQRALAREVLGHPGLFVALACNRQGHLAARGIFQVLEGEELEGARRQLASGMDVLTASRHGRLAVALLKPMDA